MSPLTFADKLKKTADTAGSILSVGYDPAPINFPLNRLSGYDESLPNPLKKYDSAQVRDQIISYFQEFINEFENSEAKIGSFKLNLGYYRMFDQPEEYPGSDALFRILEMMNNTRDIPIILDVKDADIARSSAAYAISKLKLNNVDAITVHPYMGTDSVEPFIQFASERNQGIFILTRTTNSGAEDFQELCLSTHCQSNSHGSNTSSDNLYMKVAEKIVDWSNTYPGAVGSVVAGNEPNELYEIANYYAEQAPEIPLLMPGIGTQGGEASQVMEALNSAGFDPRLVRVNSSSGIMYRAQKDGLDVNQHATASVDEIERLNKEINLSSYLA